MKKLALGLWIAIGLVVLLVIVGGCAAVASLGGGGDDPGHKTTSDSSAAADNDTEAATEPDGPATSFEDGTYLVGSDVEPGTYKTTGPPDDAWVDSCYWERSKDDSGSFDSIITNDNISGPGRVTVNSGEVFKVSGDCEWILAK